MKTLRPTVPVLATWMALSGGATLAAEALGSRVLRPMLGSTALAQTGTLAGVLGALGFGAWWSGRLLTRGGASPSRVLSRSHGALAAYALAASLAPEFAVSLSARLFVGLSAVAPWLGDGARLLAALAVTAVPGALAGSAYPAVVSLFARGAGVGTAMAGASSSLGAAAAALVTTFAVCPSLGVAHTLTLVAAVYALLAAAASRFESAALPATPAPLRTAPLDLPVMGALLALGVASTAWQVLLGRAASLSFGPSAFAFAAALAAHVTALALGELAALRAVSRADGSSSRGALALLTAVASVAALASRPLLAAMPAWAERLLEGGAPAQSTLWLSAYGALVAGALPVVGVVGAAMGFAARALVTDNDHTGEANGRALGVMALGNVLGALAMSFVAMPALGVERAAVVVGIVLAAGVAGAGRRGLAAALVVAMALAMGRAPDEGAMLRGPFLYAGSRDVELGRLAWRRDEAEATVAVRRDDEGNVLLQINGKVDATSLGDQSTQTVVGLLPVAFARDPRDVLVVGLGSGMTADASRAVPGVRSVEVAELVRGVIDAARGEFARANHRVLEDRRVRVVQADAAHLLRGTSRRYDAIVSEPSNPWVAGMSDLFTREAFEAARARLRPGGVFGAWFHAYSTSAEVVSSIAATFHAVFPEAALVEVTPGQDYLLLGFRDGRIDLDATLRRLEDPTAQRLLRAANVGDPAALLARFVGGRRAVETIAGDAPVLRASDLTLEFVAPSLLYRDATDEVFARFARVDDLPLAGLVRDMGPGSAWLRLVDESEPRREANTHLRAMVLAQRQGDLPRALREGELAVGFDTRDLTARTLLARLYLVRAAQRAARRDRGGAEEDLTAALELRPPDAERFRALVRLGDLALKRRDGQRALARFEEALTLARASGEPASELHVRMAEALALLGAPDQAAEALDRAIRDTRDGRRREELEALRAGVRSR